MGTVGVGLLRHSIGQSVTGQGRDASQPYSELDAGTLAPGQGGGSSMSWWHIMLQRVFVCTWDVIKQQYIVYMCGCQQLAALCNTDICPPRTASVLMTQSSRLLLGPGAGRRGVAVASPPRTRCRPSSSHSTTKTTSMPAPLQPLSTPFAGRLASACVHRLPVPFLAPP